MGEKGEPLFSENELTQEGLSGEYDAYLMPDPSMGSKGMEREISSMFYSLLMQNMIVGTDPVKIYKVTADLIRAWGKDPVQYLGPEPSSDLVDEPEDENTLIVQGDFERVKAQITENHLLHIQKHMQLLESPSLAALPPALVQQVSQFTQQHIMEHQMMMQAMMSLVQKLGGQSGESSSPKGAKTAFGMENTSGPLAGAMQEQNKGVESGNPSRSYP